MTIHFHNTSLSLAFNGIQAAKEVEKSTAKLSSGKKHVYAGDDVGGFKQSVRIGNEQNLNSLTLQNLQNLISYSQTQEGALAQAGKVLQRMNFLAELSLDVTKTDVDRNAYNHEFIELAEELQSIKGLELNELNLFINDPVFSDQKKQFIQVLQSQWLKGAEQAVSDRLGLQGTGQNTLKIEVPEDETFPTIWSYSSKAKTLPDGSTIGETQVQFFLDTYVKANFPLTTPSDWAERYNVTLMTQLVMADNLYYNALANGNENKGTSTDGGAQWFKEGVSEFTHGGDYLMGSFDSSLVSAIGNGDTPTGSIQQRISNYVAVRYLHEELKAAGTTEGVKTMLGWMSAQVTAGKTAEESSIGAALVHFIPAKYNNVATANDEFVADYVANGYSDMSSKIKLNYDPFDPRGYYDTGAIGGFDADGGSVIDHQGAVPNSGPGYDSTTPTEAPISGFNLTWEQEGEELFTYDPSGKSTIFETVKMVTIDDTGSYNLKTIDSARSTLNMMDEWIETLAGERSRVGANMQRVLTEKDRFEGKFNAQQSALERIADTDFAKESTTLAKNQIRTQGSLAILSQGQESSVSLQKLLAGIQMKSKRPNSAPPTS
jgi:flagellin